MSKSTNEKLIDWDDAPEGATHYMPESESYVESWVKDIIGDRYSYKWMNDETWGKARFARPKEDFNLLIERPEPIKPIYTNEMADKGELPSVGMEYLCGDGQRNKCLSVYGDICIGLTIEHVETNDYLPLSQTTRGNCKPLTPPKTDEEKAIDEACLIIDDSIRCKETNVNIDCSAAQKAVIVTMIKKGYKLEAQS